MKNQRVTGQIGKRVSQLPEALVANLGNGWRAFKKGNRYWAECARGSRPRKRFKTKQEAIDHATVNSRLQGNRNAPLMNIQNEKLTLVQNLAALLEDATPTEVAALQTILATNKETLRTLQQLVPPIMEATDKHKAATLVLATLQKLHPARSHWTVARMVAERIAAKREAIAGLPDEKRKAQAIGHLNQVIEMGDALNAILGGDTDIDSITSDEMDDFMEAYIERRGGTLAKSTQAARMNLAAQFFNHAENDSWLGKNPCRQFSARRANVPVALVFEEFAGVMIASLYLNPQVALIFAYETLAALRGNEARGIQGGDIDLQGMRLYALPKANSHYGPEGTGTTLGDDVEKRAAEVIDALYQWIRYLYDPKYAQGWTLDRKGYNDILAEARKMSECIRWGKKGTGRHTGRNLYRKWSIPLWKIQEQIGHRAGSPVTDRNYLARLTSDDAGAILLVTPYHLGLISEPYPYELPPEDVLHLGFRVKLGPNHQPILDKYLPKLREIHEKVKAKLGIKPA